MYWYGADRPLPLSQRLRGHPSTHGDGRQRHQVLQDAVGLLPFPAPSCWVTAIKLQQVMPGELSRGDLTKAETPSVFISLTLRLYQPEHFPALPRYTKDIVKAFALLIKKPLANFPG